MRTAFTLIEMIAVLTLTAAIAGVTAPILLSASGAFTDANARRDRTEAASMALERVVRTLREMPDRGQNEPGVPAIAGVSGSSITMDDGTAFSLNGEILSMTVAGVQPARLCTGVEAFELTFFGSDGSALDPSAAGTPALVRMIEIRLARTGAIELRTRVLLRCTLGSP